MYVTSSGIVIPSRDSMEPLKHGEDGYVYRYNDLVVKFLHSGYMTHAKAKQFLEALRHELLLGPKELLYNMDEHFVGYLVDYVEDIGLLNMTSDDFLTNVAALRECYDLFTSQRIFSMDDYAHNIIINKKIYMIDFDRYGAWINLPEDTLQFGNAENYQTLVRNILRTNMFPGENAMNDEFYDWIEEEVGWDKDMIDFLETDLKGTSRVDDYLEERREYITKKYTR